MMNCEKCGSDCHYVSEVVHEPDLDHEGEFERDDEGYKLWTEYKITVCLECQHKKRRYTRHLAEDFLPDDPLPG